MGCFKIEELFEEKLDEDVLYKLLNKRKLHTEEEENLDENSVDISYI